MRISRKKFRTFFAIFVSRPNLVPRGRVPLVPCGRETRTSGIIHSSATFDWSKTEHEQ